MRPKTEQARSEAIDRIVIPAEGPKTVERVKSVLKLIDEKGQGAPYRTTFVEIGNSLGGRWDSAKRWVEAAEKVGLIIREPPLFQVNWKAVMGEKALVPTPKWLKRQKEKERRQRERWAETEKRYQMLDAQRRDRDGGSGK